MFNSDLYRALRLLELEPKRVLAAVAAGVATLASALMLAGLSAWLITRAWQMPPVLDLSVAVVSVRALGISRGLFRYMERLATHDLALRGTTTARTRLYEQLATGKIASDAWGRGGMLARLGKDVDTLGEVVTRALVPMAVSAIMMIAATATLWFVSPAAALVLAAALAVAGIAAPLAAAHAARIDEFRGAGARAEFHELAVRAIDHAAELRVAGRMASTLRQSRSANAAYVESTDKAAAPAALALAATPLAIGASVLGSLMIGLTLYGPGGGTPGGMTPMSLAILVLLPLAAFEATSALPGAAIALSRARSAAVRLAPSALVSRKCRSDVLFRSQARSAIVGPSGSGKTTLLMAHAGLLGPNQATEEQRQSTSFFPEDAHIFETSVLENLRVARGDLTELDARAALTAVGLSEWLCGLSRGLDTVLVGGDEAVSGGERRRLLLARALVSPAQELLLDEPTEHLDAESGEHLLRALLDQDSGLIDSQKTVVVVTHQLPPNNAAEQVITLAAEISENTLHSQKSARTFTGTRERRWSEVG